MKNLNFTNPLRFQARVLLNSHLSFMIVFITGFSSIYGQEWTNSTNLPSAGRFASAAFAIGDTGYIIGGISGNGALNDVWTFIPQSNSWTQQANAPGSTRLNPVGFELNGFGYYGLGDASFGDSLLYKYSPSTNSWQQVAIPNFTVTNWRAMFFTIENDAYFLFHTTNTFARYNSLSDTWEQLQDFPGIARFTGAGFTANGKGYITCMASCCWNI